MGGEKLELGGGGEVRRREKREGRFRLTVFQMLPKYGIHSHYPLTSPVHFSTLLFPPPLPRHPSLSHRKTVVVGSGYIAVELAGILNALGSDVSIVVRYNKARSHGEKSNIFL